MPSPDEEARYTGFEEGKAHCMAALGFEYWPIPYDEQQLYEEDPSLGLDPRQYAEEYGFGISIWPPLADPATTPTITKYLTYMEGLTPVARDAYNMALYGQNAPVETEEAMDAVREIPEGASCVEQVSRELDAQIESSEQTAYRREASNALRQLLSGEYERMWTQADADPRTIAAWSTYSNCLADAGYPGFEYRGNTLYESLLAEFHEQFPERHATTDQVGLGEFREREVAAARANASCDAPVRAVAVEVMADLEQDIVNRIGPQLEAWEELYGPYLN